MKTAARRKGDEMLEPYEGKLSRTVLRGLETGNGLRLLGIVKIREKGRVVDKIKRIIFGNPGTRDIETTNIENFNGILRERVGRLVRKTKCYSKKKSRLRNATELIQFHWNFMDTIHDNLTPAMIESLSNGIWSWEDFLLFHYAV